MIAAIVVGWRLGANAVLSFWLAYILTRPLGANLGDWFASPPEQHGLGLGYAITSVIFLGTILVAVVYLTVSRADVIERADERGPNVMTPRPVREHVMLGYYAVVAGTAAALLVWAAGQPHAAPASASEEEDGSPSTSATLAPGQATVHFPPADVTTFRVITQDTLTKLQAGDQAAATARITDLETAWDDNQSNLQPMDPAAWTVLDGQIDAVLKAMRASNPDVETEVQSLNTLSTSLHA
jgi:hypothetical protein